MDLFEQAFKGANKVTLKSWSIENYRGVISDTIQTSGKDVVFLGDSGTGKTTRIEALLWLLTGRLFDGSVNQLNDYIMPKNSTQETVLSVSAEFEVGMDVFVFTKQMKEKWVKKRGTEEVVYDGIDTVYYVNGVIKSTVKDFNKVLYRCFGLEDAIRKIEDETKLLSKVDLIMLLTVLDFFPTLDNKTLRELVLLVGGRVEVSKLEMSDNLREVLKSKSYDIDDLKKTIKDRLNGNKTTVGLCDSKKKAQTLIEEKQKSIEGLNVSELGSVEQQLKDIETELDELRLKEKQSEQDALREIDYKIRDVEIKIEELKKEQGTSVEEPRIKYEKSVELVSKKKDEIKQIDHLIEVKIDTKTNIMDIGRGYVEQKKQLSEHDEITCPNCNHVFRQGENQKELAVIIAKIAKIKKDALGIEDEIKQIRERKLEAEKELILLEHERDDALLFYQNAIKPSKQADTSVLEANPLQDLNVQLNHLKNEKTRIEIEYLIVKKGIEAKINTLIENRQTLNDKYYKLRSVSEVLTQIDKLQQEINDTSRSINTLEQLEIEIKLLEEDYLKAIDENLKNAFGENIRFKMFDTNLSNDNLTPICEMYVRDSYGRWVNAINGVNTGHSVPRLVEFLVRVRRALGIRDGLLLIDFFESIGAEPLKELQALGQQIVATEVRRDLKELKVEIIEVQDARD